MQSLDPTFTDSKAHENAELRRENKELHKENEVIGTALLHLKAQQSGVDWNRQMLIFWVFAFCALVAFVMVMA